MLAHPRGALPFVRAAILVTIAGCLSHSRGDDAGLVADTRDTVDASEPAADVRSPPDTGDRGGDAFAQHDAPSTCGPDETWIGVRVEAITADTARCDARYIEAAALTGVSAEPAEDGIRLHFDYCPDADADCRCDVIVTHVGTDVAAEVQAQYPVDVDLAPGESAAFPNGFVSIRKQPACACDGCPCSLPLHFYAASAMPGAERSLLPDFSFGQGAEICPAVGCDFGGTTALSVTTEVGPTDVRRGETVSLGATRVRSVHDVEILAPCAACAGCASPYGSWAAWVPLPPSP